MMLDWLIPTRIISWFDPPILQTWLSAPLPGVPALFVLEMAYESGSRILRDRELANAVLRSLRGRYS